MRNFNAPLKLTIEPTALERCFLVADIFEEKYAEKTVEYGLIGLARQSRPFHVIETPLLPGQTVSSSCVVQSGHNVIRLRRTIDQYSRERKETLVPICFIHRHPGSCDPSYVDFEFLTGVFIDQVASLLTFRQPRWAASTDLLCHCRSNHPIVGSSTPGDDTEALIDVELAVCFSLIVNNLREHSLRAVCKEFCPHCAAAYVRPITAEIRAAPMHQLSEHQLLTLKSDLAREIETEITVSHSTRLW